MNRFSRSVKLFSKSINSETKHKLKFGVIYNEYLGLPLAAGGFLYSFKLMNSETENDGPFDGIARFVVWPWVATGCTVSGMMLGTFPLPTLTAVALWKLGNIKPSPL